MEIILPFPEYSPSLKNDYSSKDVYASLRMYLKQLELVVHHAQKSIEHAEADGLEISEDSHVVYEHPQLEGNTKEEKEFVLNSWEELQRIELKMNLV